MNENVIVWKNGECMPLCEVRISPFDLGLSVGVGVFETLASYDGKVFAWKRHWERMKRGANRLKLCGGEFLDFEVIDGAMKEVLGKNDLSEGLARVRVSWSGGDTSLGGEENAQGVVMVTAVSCEEPLPCVRLAEVPLPVNEASPLVGVKSSSFAENVLTLRRAKAMGADEAIRCNRSGELCECAMANLFFVKEGVVMTPALESGCLPGITREIVLEICESEGIPYEEGLWSVESLKNADELFITSSIREVQKAVLGGGELLSPPLATSVTAQIASLYQRGRRA